jgi:hypothetical protein
MTPLEDVLGQGVLSNGTHGSANPNPPPGGPPYFSEGGYAGFSRLGLASGEEAWPYENDEGVGNVLAWEDSMVALWMHNGAEGLNAVVSGEHRYSTTKDENHFFTTEWEKGSQKLRILEMVQLWDRDPWPNADDALAAIEWNSKWECSGVGLRNPLWKPHVVRIADNAFVGTQGSDPVKLSEWEYRLHHKAEGELEESNAITTIGMGIGGALTGVAAGYAAAGAGVLAGTGISANAAAGGAGAIGGAGAAAAAAEFMTDTLTATFVHSFTIKCENDTPDWPEYYRIVVDAVQDVPEMNATGGGDDLDWRKHTLKIKEE